MKKSTKTALISFIFIGIMAISVLSYAMMSFFSERQNKGGIAQITGYVMKENLSDASRQVYLQHGMTFLEVHYSDKDMDVLKKIEALPTQMTTATGHIQLIVIEIYDPEKSFAVAESLNGVKEMNITDAREVALALCDALFYTPVECISSTFGSSIKNKSSTSGTVAEVLYVNE